MRCCALAVVMMMLVACAPKDIALSSCKSIFLSTADAWTCTVTGGIVARPSSIAFTTDSRNQVAKVNITLRVTKGTLRVGYRDLSGEQHLLVTPAEPATLDMQTRMHPQNRSFNLFFEPVDGTVEGLEGTVKYSTP